VRRLAGFGALTLLLSACGGPGPPEGAPEHSGVIEGFEQGRVLVSSSQYGCPDSVGHDAETRVLLGSGPPYAEIGWDDLRIGHDVNVWFDGEVTASCPALGHARVVVVSPG